MSAPGGKAKILVAEDDEQLLDVLKSLFRSLEHRVKTANHPEGLADTLTKEKPDILVCDLHRWQSLLPAVSQGISLPPTLVMADYAELEQARQAVSACKHTSLLLKPVRTQAVIQELESLLGRVGETSGTCASADPDLEDIPVPQAHFGLLVGEHPLMQAIYDDIRRVGQTDLTVLIRGESGTGKDLVARAIHHASPRARGPFVAINCTSMQDTLLESELFGHVRGAFTGATQAKDGLFKAAEGGTIFLDEIGSIPVSMQLSLLRVLENKTFRPVGSTKTLSADVRVIAATNENLEARIHQGLFREDLFFRLAGFPMHLPSLREHASDIPLLAQALLAKAVAGQARTVHFESQALRALESYDWPGNVRELSNVIQRTVATLGAEDSVLTPALLNLPSARRPATCDSGSVHTTDATTFITLKAHLKQCERDYLTQVYEACGRNKERAAKVLGISIGTLYRKLEA